MVKDMESNALTEGRVRGVQVSTRRTDGWTNLMAGLGNKNIDKTENSYYGNMPIFQDNELSRMYMGEGMAKRIIDLLPQDATRAWIETPKDPTGKLLKELKRLGAKQAFKKALSWSRLYRGAVIVMIEKGAVDLEKPFPKTIKALEKLRVYSAAKIDISTADIVREPASPFFDDVEFFPIRFRDGIIHRVHSSRCLVFKGEESPDEETVDFKYKYWGIPVMMKIYDRLKNWGAVEKGIANLMMEVNIGKYTLSNLAQILSQNTTESLELIYNRLDVINASKSMINAVLLGDGESYERDSASLSGIDSILDRMMISLAAVSDYPVTRLWGRSPAGMNSTGESDITQYYDDVSSIQEIKVESPLQKLMDIIGMYLHVADTSFDFCPLWQPTEKEWAEIEKLHAETDHTYITDGVVDPSEVRQKRFPDLDGDVPELPEDETLIQSTPSKTPVTFSNEEV